MERKYWFIIGAIIVGSLILLLVYYYWDSDSHIKTVIAKKLADLMYSSHMEVDDELIGWTYKRLTILEKEKYDDDNSRIIFVLKVPEIDDGELLLSTDYYGVLGYCSEPVAIGY
ncbi:MAG: hypothetical protein DRP00_03545 [Candidatus Aenigmatarchaeota archaeon]|nr:MAG: hypothetical protein DRP00_03545 [Candidatus Aenigmarchaeota archaeon]